MYGLNKLKHNKHLSFHQQLFTSPIKSVFSSKINAAASISGGPDDRKSNHVLKEQFETFVNQHYFLSHGFSQ
jgi:hypothetical protein